MHDLSHCGYKIGKVIQCDRNFLSYCEFLQFKSIYIYNKISTTDLDNKQN